MGGTILVHINDDGIDAPEALKNICDRMTNQIFCIYTVEPKDNGQRYRTTLWEIRGLSEWRDVTYEIFERRIISKYPPDSIWYRTESRGVVLYADMPGVCQDSGDPRLNIGWLSTGLMNAAPSFVRDASPYQGEETVFFNEIVESLCPEYNRNRCQRLARLDDSTAVEATLTTLFSILEECVERYGYVSSDISGGLDSTSLASIALNKDALKCGFISLPNDPKNNDLNLARLASREFGIDLHVLPPFSETGSSNEADLREYTRDLRVGPPLWGNGGRYLSQVLSISSDLECGAHLVGLGGDDLYSPQIAVLSDIPARHYLRRQYRQRIRYIMASLRLRLSDVSDFFGVGREPNQEFALRLAGRFGEGQLHATELWSWFPGFRFFSFASAKAREAACEFSASNYPGNDVISYDGVARWQVRENLKWQRKNVALMNSELAGAEQVEVVAPFLDPRLEEIILNCGDDVLLGDGTYKPVLRRAVSGLVPSAIVNREDKGDFTSSVLSEFVSNRERIVNQVANGVLADEGLVDVDKLVKSSYAANLTFEVVDEIFSCMRLGRWVENVLA